MFPVNVTDVCRGVEPVPVLPIIVFLVVFVGLVPWIWSHCCTRFEYQHLDHPDESGMVYNHDTKQVRSISWTIRTPAGILCTILSVISIAVYSAICLRDDQVVIGLISLGCILFAFVAIFNGDPDDDSFEQVVKTFLHKFSAAGSFIFLMVTGIMTVIYFSYNHEDYIDRAIISYVFFAITLQFFLTMVISIALSEGNWHPIITGASEWGYAGGWAAIMALIPGQVTTS
jgi:hypothetical protein